MRLRVLMSGMVLGLASACGGTAESQLFNGSSPDSGTKPGSDSSTPPSDASADARSDSSIDSSTDAGADSQAIDAKPVDAGCPSFCATHTPMAGTCSDFDESSAIPSTWTVVTNSGGSVTISEAEAVSCSNSLSADLPQVTLGSVTSADALADTPFALSSASTASLDLEVYLPDNDTKSYVTFFALKLGDGAALGLQHHGDAFWFLGNSSYTSSINVSLTTAPLVGAWNHMTLTVVYGPSAGSATLTYEGEDHAMHTVNFTGATSSGSASGGTAIVGMSAPGQTEAEFTAYYDNVIVRTPK
jgi:hypothetical protein